MKIEHQRIRLNWLSHTEISEPKTLILGSFNPYNPSKPKDWVDYYYGRKENNFWKSISKIKTNKEWNCNLDCKKEIMHKNFCCLDVIDSLDINYSDNKNLDMKILNEFIENEIFTEFSDQTIWTTKTNYKSTAIIISRNYNQDVITFLEKSDTIKKVIHTMGKNRINSCFDENPKENKLKEKGFSEYYKQIIKICGDRSIEFIKDCPSPSGRIRGEENQNELISFYSKHI
jgi:hypothetical protein